MGGGLESRYIGGVYGADGAQHHPHRTYICCNSTSSAPDGRMYPKHVELRIH